MRALYRVKRQRARNLPRFKQMEMQRKMRLHITAAFISFPGELPLGNAAQLQKVLWRGDDLHKQPARLKHAGVFAIMCRGKCIEHCVHCPRLQRNVRHIRYHQAHQASAARSKHDGIPRKIERIKLRTKALRERTGIIAFPAAGIEHTPRDVQCKRTSHGVKHMRIKSIAQKRAPAFKQRLIIFHTLPAPGGEVYIALCGNVEAMAVCTKKALPRKRKRRHAERTAEYAGHIEFCITGFHTFIVPHSTAMCNC